MTKAYHKRIYLTYQIFTFSFLIFCRSSLSADNNSPYAKPVVEIKQVDPTVFFRKAGTGLEQAVDVTVSSNTKLKNVLFKLEYGDEQSFSGKLEEVEAAEQTVRLFFPDVRDQSKINFSLRRSGKVLDEMTTDWVPERHWTVYLVHGSHHDLGYTDLPDRVLKEHKGYIEDIIKFCELTEHWPKESRFHYTFEAGWSVQYFLEHTSDALREKFAYYLQNGQLELTAFFVDPVVDMFGFEELNRSVYSAFDLKRKYKIQIRTAEINDIPGINWATVSVLAGSGVKYLVGGIQDYHSWGRTVPAPWDEDKVAKRDHASAFYWEGPTGDSILFWYNSGEIANVDLWDEVQGEAALNKYLITERKNGYEFDMIMTKVIGGMRDNSLPDLMKSEIVKALNEKWEYPKIRFTTNAVFFEDFEEMHGASLKTIRGNFNQTDYILAPLGTPVETGINRTNHKLVTTAEKFSSIASSITDYPYAKEEIEEAYERMMLYDEHCWAMAHPTGAAQRAVESQKGQNVYQAAALGEDVLVKSLNKITDQIELQNEGIYVVVFNPLSTSRSDVVEVKTKPDTPIGKPFYEEKRQLGAHTYTVNRSGEVDGRKQFSIPSYFLEEPFQVHDLSSGKIIEHQLRVISDPLQPVPDAAYRYALSHSTSPSLSFLSYQMNQATDLCFVAEDIPPLGYKVFLLLPYYASNDSTLSKSPAIVNEQYIENQYYQVTYDKIKGVTGVTDKEQDKLLTDSAGHLTLGQVLIKKVQSPDFFEPEIKEISVKENGPVFTSLSIKRRGINTPIINQEITIYHGLKRIDLATRIFKDPTPFYEIYIGFPFHIEQPKFSLQLVNSSIEPIVDQLPGTSTDYYAIRNNMSVFNDETTISWSSIDAPVLKLGEIWPDYISHVTHGVEPHNYIHDFVDQFETSNVFSYVSLNNFRTGFTPVFSGEMLFRHSFTSTHGTYDPNDATSFGEAASNPLVPVIMNGPNPGELPLRHSFAKVLNADNISIEVIKAAEDGNGLIIRLSETAGKYADFILEVPFVDLQEVYKTNITEENAKALVHSDRQISVSAKPYEILSLRLVTGKLFPVKRKFFYSH